MLSSLQTPNPKSSDEPEAGLHVSGEEAKMRMRTIYVVLDNQHAAKDGRLVCVAQLTCGCE